MLAVIDFRAPQNIINGLKKHGFEILPLPSHPALPVPVSAHPDMLLFFAKDRILCTKEYKRIASRELSVLEKAAKRPIVCVEERVQDRYPNDILLNAAIVGQHLFCLAEYTAKEIRSDTQYTVCNVRQGYAKCSVVPIDGQSLITEDASIEKSATSMGLSVLKIDATHIELPGYDTGFLGGATSYAPYGDIDEIYFCGHLESHPQAKKIHAFCEKRGKKAISLSEDPLFDLGTVFLMI